MQNKLIPGILLGAVIGGTITLADKSTRQSLKQSIKDAKEGNRSQNLQKLGILKMKFFIGKM